MDEQQTSLFHEDIYDALRELVAALGGPKKVGKLVRTELNPDIAGAWLKDCLNRERREKLDPEQFALLLSLGRDAGVHCAMRFLANNTGYDAKPIDPEDELTKLQREYVASVQRQENITARMERLVSLTQPKIKAVS